jgi:hypothetical protein
MNQFKYLGEGTLPLTKVGRNFAISCSLGSENRNYHFRLRFLGKEYHLCRVGVKNLEEMRGFFLKFDSTAGAFGIGGCDLGIRIGKNESLYHFHDVKRACEVIKVAPYDDGYALKRIIEPSAVKVAAEYLGDNEKHCLIPVGCERWPLVRACQQAGLEVRVGDPAFALGIGGIISPSALEFIVPVLMPIAGRLPFEWLYPTGDDQDKRDTLKFKDAFDWADLIAGDFHYLGKYAPEKLSGKVILTNTTTVENREFLKKAGVKVLVTTTPKIGERTPGTNALWALLATVLRNYEMLPTEANLKTLISEVNLEPEVIPFY